MKYNQTKGSGTAHDETSVSAESQLLAEILTRMNAQSEANSQRVNQNVDDDEVVLDIAGLFYFVLSKLYYLLIGALVGAVLLGLYASSHVVPIYRATAKLYIMGQSDYSIISDLQIGTVLTMDYQEVFKTWEVHQLVNEQLGLDYSYSALQSMLTVENPEDTRIMYITVRHTDPQLAADIANAYASAAKQFITETMNTDEPSLFSVALVPGVSSTRGVTSYVIRGILLGTFVAGAILVLIFFLDNRPKSPDDIMKCAGIPTLAVIPVDTNMSKRKSHGTGKAG